MTANLGRPDGTLDDPFSPLGTQQVGSSAVILSGDVDGDTFTDVVVLSGEGDRIWVLLNRSVLPCGGDCDHTGTVTVDELIRGVSILLGESAVGACAAVDSDGDGSVTVEELVGAVANALTGCPAG